MMMSQITTDLFFAAAEFYVAGILIVPIVDYTDSGAEVEVMVSIQITQRQSCAPHA